MLDMSNLYPFAPPLAPRPMQQPTAQAVPVSAVVPAAVPAPQTTVPKATVDPWLAQAQQMLARNSAWTKPGVNSYNTVLTPQEELGFRQWLQMNKVPFNLNEQIQDYDMRGFYKALMAGNPIAKGAIDPNDQRMHYPDYWKTPYHQTFSNESQWADPAKAPRWNEKDQLVLPDGTVLFDDRAPKKEQ
jgi:hypothetical protein